MTTKKSAETWSLSCLSEHHEYCRHKGCECPCHKR